jgi:peptidyl-dipeptidase Dcp
VTNTFLAYALRSKTISVAAFSVLPFYSTSAWETRGNKQTSTMTGKMGGDDSGSCLAATALDVDAANACVAATNPLLGDWSSEPFHLPPFASIEPSHFPEALKEGMRAHIEDLQAIATIHLKDSNFDNTIAAYDRAGKLFNRVNSVFSNLCNSKNTDELQTVQTDMTPLLSRHESACFQLPGLFERIQHIYENRHQPNVTASREQMRLVERIHLDFTRKGAGLAQERQAELADLEAEMASLSTAFQQNVMKDEETYELVLHLEDLSG